MTEQTDWLANVTSNYAYDQIYELTQVTQGANTTESYSYDPVGNRLASLGVASYTTNNANELTATSTTSYGYDNNGNTISKADPTGTTTYAWDFENRLTSVTLPGSGGTISFKYDPLGRRIYKSSSAGTSIYAYDANNLIEEVNSSGTVVARYTQTQNIDEPLAQLRSGASSYYEADGLGSITSLSSGSGTLAQTYTFDSFGKQIGSSGSLTNAFRYTGREFDAETNLYFYRARYYDPSTGRLLSEDPWDSNPMYDDSNLYVYVENSPTNFVDPLGLYTVKPGVPAPSPALDKLLKCIDGCLKIQVYVTGTTPLPGEKHQDPGHAAGTSADIKPPAGIPADKVFCCAGKCGAAWGINEDPGNGGQPTQDTTAANYHFQLKPPNSKPPKSKNAIPPGCTPGGGC